VTGLVGRASAGVSPGVDRRDRFESTATAHWTAGTGPSAELWSATEEPRAASHPRANEPGSPTRLLACRVSKLPRWTECDAKLTIEQCSNVYPSESIPFRRRFAHQLPVDQIDSFATLRGALRVVSRLASRALPFETQAMSIKASMAHQTRAGRLTCTRRLAAWTACSSRRCAVCGRLAVTAPLGLLSCGAIPPRSPPCSDINVGSLLLSLLLTASPSDLGAVIGRAAAPDAGRSCDALLLPFRCRRWRALGLILLVATNVSRVSLQSSPQWTLQAIAHPGTINTVLARPDIAIGRSDTPWSRPASRETTSGK
jgi:hypothetical protein